MNILLCILCMTYTLLIALFKHNVYNIVHYWVLYNVQMSSVTTPPNTPPPVTREGNLLLSLLFFLSFF